MPSFEYTGRGAGGSPATGVMEGSSADAVATELLAQGITPVSILPARTAGTGTSKNSLDIGKIFRSARDFSTREGQVKPDELLMFCRQMYALIKAGCP